MVVRYSDQHLNTGPVFKCRSEYWTKFSLVFKWHPNTGPLDDQRAIYHANTRLVRYSDPQCIAWIGLNKERCRSTTLGNGGIENVSLKPHSCT